MGAEATPHPPAERRPERRRGMSAEGAIVELRDGSRMLVRPIRPEDKDAIAAGFDRLSAESRFRRFFAPLTVLGPDELAYLTEVDHHDHEALIGFDAETREPVGVARFIRNADPHEAEVAVTVVDNRQGRGAASALLDRLVTRARDEGITHFLAIVLSDNREAIEMFDSVAPPGSSRRRTASGHVELVIELPEPGTPTRESKLGRTLRAAARGVLEANPWYLIRQRIDRDANEITDR
jgi:GNAT superfamily N-acetyltransferase